MPEVLKISIALTSKQIVSLRGAVKTGGYATVSEVIREAIRGWQAARDAKRARKRSRTKAKAKPRRRRPLRKKSRKKKL